VKQSPNAKICDIQLVANKVFITTPSCKAQWPCIVHRSLFGFYHGQISILSLNNVRYIMNIFCIVSRKHGNMGKLTTSYSWKEKSSTIIFKKVCFLGKGHPRCTFLRCQHSRLQVVLTSSEVDATWGVTLRTHGSCLTMSNVFKDGPPWLIMRMT
jgi:hypothetical protein